MPYTQDTKITPALQIERDMLVSGRSYREVSSETGVPIGTVKERNRLIYRIDLRRAYMSRVDRDGVPNRYNAGDQFGYWFSGYFDGEGCLTVFERSRHGVSERRVGVQIACRQDDAGVLAQIQDALGVGTTWDTPARGRTNPARNWRVERVANLAEVIVPLFDQYPLRSKKRLEYAIWRSLVINQYMNTLGGTATRVGATEQEHASFQQAREMIRKIRHGWASQAARCRVPLIGWEVIYLTERL